MPDMERLSQIAAGSPLGQQLANMRGPDFNKFAEEIAKAPVVTPVPAAVSTKPNQPVMNRKQRRGLEKKRGKKKTNRDHQVHQYAERVRRMTDDQIWAEGHKEPSLEVVEKVVRDIHEDLLSVLAPHFGDDIMKKIAEVLGNWYHVDTSNYQFEGEVKEDGIDRPLTESDRTVAGGPEQPVRLHFGD